MDTFRSWKKKEEAQDAPNRLACLENVEDLQEDDDAENRRQ